MTIKKLSQRRETFSRILGNIQSPADYLVQGAYEELYLSPKPGLVDKFDNGSHPDLSLKTMEASISLLKPYLSEIADAAGRNAKLEELKEIGKRAEENMFRECGTNTHKGYIFLSGLVILSLMKYKNIREGISRESAKFFKMDIPESNGSTTRKVYHIDGICGECMNGMPSVFEHSLPAMRSVFKNTYDEYPAKLMAMAKLMQHVQDTTSYHRCGEQGIEIIKKDGAELESILMEGGNPKVWLVEKNEQYKNIRLTMGGVADLLGITFALYRLYTD